MKNIICIILLIACFFLGYKNCSSQSELEKMANNYKALNISKNRIDNECIAYQFRVSQLNYINDSLIYQMDSIRKANKIKDKEIQSLSYLKNRSTKTDTIFLLDTIFVENLKIDTTLQDPYYSLCLQLEYPNTIICTPTFISDTYINTYARKETINKPRKFFLFRLFQKKHIVTKVNITEKNPYIQTEEKVFINIVE